jgi:hypothetical protein
MHLGEHVGGLVCLDVDAQARADSEVERFLNGRDPVPHLHFDRHGEGDSSASVGDLLPLAVDEVAAVNVGVVFELYSSV